MKLDNGYMDIHETILIHVWKHSIIKNLKINKQNNPVKTKLPTVWYFPKSSRQIQFTKAASIALWQLSLLNYFPLDWR